jgi:hypothetical protein
MVALSLRAALLLCSAPVSAAVSPCAPGWVYFPDLANREFVASLGVSRCEQARGFFKLPAHHPGQRPPLPLPAVGGGRGGVPLRATGEWLPLGVGQLYLPPAPGKPPRAPVVLVGGTQNPAATGPRYAKSGNRVWVDKFTNPASTTTPAKTNWVPGQPE